MPAFASCACPQRMMRAVALLGEAEVADIQAQEGKIEVTCECVEV